MRGSNLYGCLGEEISGQRAARAKAHGESMPGRLEEQQGDHVVRKGGKGQWQAMRSGMYWEASG